MGNRPTVPMSMSISIFDIIFFNFIYFGLMQSMTAYKQIMPRLTTALTGRHFIVKSKNIIKLVLMCHTKNV